MAYREMEYGGGQYEVIATSTSNKTYAYQLAELWSSYNSLTNEEKTRCVIIDSSVIFSPTTLNGRFISITYSQNDEKWYLRNLSLNPAKYFSTSNLSTTSEDSGLTNSGSLILAKIC